MQCILVRASALVWVNVWYWYCPLQWNGAFVLSNCATWMPVTLSTVETLVVEALTTIHPGLPPVTFTSKLSCWILWMKLQRPNFLLQLKLDESFVSVYSNSNCNWDIVILMILTHWGRVTHICVGNLTIIGSDNGLSPGRRQADWTNSEPMLEYCYLEP